MTSPELAAKIKAGATTVIIPTGGTEQNGPHMILGKHNKIVYYTAGEIAKKLGNAVVAPVIAYVPEGRINPPEGHMNFAGTLSVREDTFEALLKDTAASLKQHGFTLICFIGDSGDNQRGQKEIAEKLSREWKASGVRVLHVSDYYDNNGQEAWFKMLPAYSGTVGAHAGFEDTSELMAVDKNGVREKLRGGYTQKDYETSGATGDSTQANAAQGHELLKMKIDVAVKQIKNAPTN